MYENSNKNTLKIDSIERDICSILVQYLLPIYYCGAANLIIAKYQFTIMKHCSPDIAWHGEQQRILSIDFHPFTNEFATAGSQDKRQDQQKTNPFSGCVKIWQLDLDNLNDPNLKYGITDLKANVNCVKYSPDGRFLAIANDEKEIMVFTQSYANVTISSQQKIFRWASPMKLNGHGQDVIDLAWSKNCQYLASASMDGTVKFWVVGRRNEFKNVASFDKSCQGVAMHPNIEYIIAVGNDQCVKMLAPTTGNKKSRLFDSWYVKKNFEKYHYNKGVLEKEEAEKEEEKAESFKMFANQSVASFFRRPSISPDGELFILPCGIWRSSKQQDPTCCAYLFRKNYYSRPSFAISTNKEPALVCKFCPVLFKKKNPEEGMFKQPYYMVFAVATTNSVLIYSTDSPKPLYGMGNWHFAAHTDLSWKDDKVLAISSSDGFISFFIFNDNELGEIYEPEEGPLKEMITKTKYVPPVKEVPQQVGPISVQQTIQVQTATGVKKKIIPSVITKHDM